MKPQTWKPNIKLQCEIVNVSLMSNSKLLYCTHRNHLVDEVRDINDIKETLLSTYFLPWRLLLSAKFTRCIKAFILLVECKYTTRMAREEMSNFRAPTLMEETLVKIAPTQLDIFGVEAGHTILVGDVSTLQFGCI